MNVPILGFFRDEAQLTTSVSASCANGPEIDPRVRHILSRRISPSSVDSRRADCQFLAKECALSTGKLPPGGLPRNSVVKLLPVPT